MMPILGSSLSPGDGVDLSYAYQPKRAAVQWTIRESGIVVRRGWNTLTDTGLTQIAKGWAGQGSAPLYLVIDSYKAAIQNVGGISIGATSVQLDTDPTKAGDTSLILGVGSANQETVTWSAKSGSGPYTFTIGATTKTHAQNDWVVRTPLQSDVLTDIKSEVQYDAGAAPNKRMKASGVGFSQGTGNYTIQFFLTGSQALANWVTLGLSDTDTVGAGLLHNHLAMGFAHSSGVDVELDISLTISN